MHAILIKQPGPASHYSEIPISRTLIFSNPPITRTKSRSLSSVEHCNFTPDFSNQFAFPLEVREIGIPLYMLEVLKQHVHGKFHILSLESKFLETYLALEMSLSNA